MSKSIANQLQERFSPKAFKSESIPKETLHALYQSAVSVASCYNEQPWRFIYAAKGTDLFNQILGLLMEGNQVWAKEAAVLGLNIVRTTFEKNGKNNFHAPHDLGLAIGALSAHAHDLGIGVHQMGGVYMDQAKTHFQLPDDYQVVSAMALGYYATDNFEESVANKTANRKTLEEVVLQSA